MKFLILTLVGIWLSGIVFFFSVFKMYKQERPPVFQVLVWPITLAWGFLQWLRHPEAGE